MAWDREADDCVKSVLEFILYGENADDFYITCSKSSRFTGCLSRKWYSNFCHKKIDINMKLGTLYLLFKNFICFKILWSVVPIISKKIRKKIDSLY